MSRPNTDRSLHARFAHDESSRPRGGTARRANAVSARLVTQLVALGLAAPALAQCLPGWVAGIGAPGPNNAVRSLAIMPNGDIVAGGSFNLIGSSQPTPNKFARYSVATGTWSSPSTGTNGSIVYALAALPDGDLLLGGNFTSIGGVSTRQFARYNFDTGTFSGLGYGNNGGQVNAILPIDATTVIIGGNCPRIAGVVANHIGRLNLTTGVWTPMNSQMVSTGDQVHCLALAPDGTVIVGGSFLSGGGPGVAASRIARYHPATNTWSALGSGMNSTVRGVAVLPDGDIVAGGTFTVAGGVPVNQVARYDVQTGVWSDMGGGISGAFDYVNAVEALADGSVVVGGSFLVVSDVPAARIARYNPTTGAWTAMGSGVNSDVDALAALPNGGVIVGGLFTNAGGTTDVRIAQYSFGATPAIDTQPDDASACTGSAASFTIAASSPPGGGALSYQWQWQPAGPATAWVNLVNGDNAEIGGTPIINAVDVSAATLAVTPLAAYIAFDPRDFRCVVTNTCASTNTAPATLTLNAPGDPACCPACPADFDLDGGVTGSDVEAFFAAFESGDACADTDQDGGVTGSDVESFFLAFEAGGC